jgi:hypothetical protein
MFHGLNSIEGTVVRRQFLCLSYTEAFPLLSKTYAASHTWLARCPRGLLKLILINASVCKQRLAFMRRGRHRRRAEMSDLIMLALGLGFFALSVGYAMACDQL